MHEIYKKNMEYQNNAPQSSPPTDSTPQGVPVKSRQELMAKVSEIRRKESESEASKIKEEWDREKMVLEGMVSKGAKGKELKCQRELVMMLSQRYYRRTQDKGLSLPEEVYNLIDTEGCNEKQQEWLMWYCFNGAHVIDACVKSGVTYSILQEWMDEESISEPRKVFRKARRDLDAAFLDLAEMKLKGLVSDNHPSSVSFFLKSRHPDYMAKDGKGDKAKEEKVKRSAEYGKVKPADKAKEFLASLGGVKVQVAKV